MKDATPENPEGKEKLPIRDALAFGWHAVRTNFWFLIGLFGIVAGIAVGGVLLILFLSSANDRVATLLGILLRLAANTIVPTGAIAVSLKLCDNVKPRIEDFLCPIKTILFYFVGSLIVGMFVVVGLLFFIVPGVYFGIRLSLCSYYIVDHGLDPIEAIKRSWEATQDNVGNLLVFMCTLFLLNLGGFLALLVGLSVTMPLSMIAGVYIYRVLQHRLAARTPPAIDMIPPPNIN